MRSRYSYGREVIERGPRERLMRFLAFVFVVAPLNVLSWFIRKAFVWLIAAALLGLLALVFIVADALQSWVVGVVGLAAWFFITITGLIYAIEIDVWGDDHEWSKQIDHVLGKGRADAE